MTRENIGINTFETLSVNEVISQTDREVKLRGMDGEHEVIIEAKKTDVIQVEIEEELKSLDVGDEIKVRAEQGRGHIQVTCVENEKLEGDSFI
jgi:hypothetical protein